MSKAVVIRPVVERGYGGECIAVFAGGFFRS
jgi:hypothetical protein